MLLRFSIAYAAFVYVLMFMGHRLYLLRQSRLLNVAHEALAEAQCEECGAHSSNFEVLEGAAYCNVCLSTLVYR